MSYIVKKAEEQITEIIKKSAEKACESGVLGEGALPGFNVEIPADRTHGDYSTNAAMASARVFRMPPVKIAAALVDNAELENTYFDSMISPHPVQISLSYPSSVHVGATVSVSVTGCIHS